MPSNKKPRKRYNPRKTTCGSSPMIRYSKAEGDALKMRIYYHLSRMSTNVGNGGDYNALIFRLRIGEGLLKHFENPDAQELVDRAIKIVDATLARREAYGAFALEDGGADVIREALAVIDDIHDQTTRIEQVPIYDQVYAALDHSLETRYP